MTDQAQQGSEFQIDQGGSSVALLNRKILVAASVDVLVTGGGPAGFGAALAAARQGASTLLIERNAILGGTATAGIMNTWNVAPDRMTGAARELATELVGRGDAVWGETVPFDVVAMADLMLQKLQEAGAQLLSYTWAVEALVSLGQVRGVLIANKSGMQAVLAKAIVDTTGDGDIVASAGGEVTKGRETDGKMRPSSVLFRLGGVDIGRVVEYARAHPAEFTQDPNFQILDINKGLVRICGFFPQMAEAQKQGEIPKDLNYIRFEGVQVNRGIVTVNNSRAYNLDATKRWDVTKADLEARKQNKLLYAFIKKHVPGCENCYVLDTATLGVRDTRRIRGTYVLTEENVVTHKIYPDTVAMIWRRMAPGHEPHSPDGKEGAPTHAFYRTAQWPLEWFEIPYRVFIPNGADGILVGGRLLSQTQQADMWTRGQYSCIVTGQVAGIAAAMAARSGIVPRNVDIRQLQDAIVRSGIEIGEVAVGDRVGS
jgi:hypothetical protein